VDGLCQIGLEEWAYGCEKMENKSFGQSRMEIMKEARPKLEGSSVKEGEEAADAQVACDCIYHPG
jgi:hypothetical protein